MPDPFAPKPTPTPAANLFGEEVAPANGEKPKHRKAKVANGGTGLAAGVVDPSLPPNLGKPLKVEVPDFSDPNRPKTCIEVDFPLTPLNLVARRECVAGSTRKPIYQSMKWWARRLGSVFRCMLLASAIKAPVRRHSDGQPMLGSDGQPLVDEDAAAQAVWDAFYANHQVPSDGKLNFEHLKVFDPFMGGGTTLVEGSRLGFQVSGVEPYDRMLALPLAGLPASVRAAGPEACRRFVEFFVATIRNPNTREAYARAVLRFLRWAEARGRRQLREIDPLTVAMYIEELGTTHSRPTTKQHLAAISRLFDWLVVGQIVPHNPASSVRGPCHVVKRGTTPVLSAEEARQLLDSISPSTIGGLRDRALIAVMVFTFARVSATVGLAVEDYYPEGKRWWIRLHEKGGKLHMLPVHHTAEQYLDDYLDRACIRGAPRTPLFQSLNRHGRLSGRSLSRNSALRMIKRRARAAALPYSTCCHTFRATGITAYLENGGTLENAQAIAAHESPRTTKLYDRTSDVITLDEIERIRI